MSDDPTTELKPTGRASSAIWAGIKYGVLAYALWYAAKLLGWVQEHCALDGEAGHAESLEDVWCNQTV